MQAVDIDQADFPFHHRHKNAILLVTLLLLMFLAPLDLIFQDSKLLDTAMATIVIVASLNAISHRKRSTVFWAIGLAVPAVIFGWVQTFDSDTLHETVAHIFGAALYIFIAALLFKVLFTEGEVKTDQIFSAVAIYIFIGLTWGHFYALEEILHPGSITGSLADAGDSSANFVYFSFVTLTTLGYGDMLPVSPGAKALVIIESITGVMFVAILVSTLVGRVNMSR